MRKNSSGKTDDARPNVGSITADGKISYFWECTNCRMAFKPEFRTRELGDIEDDKAVVQFFVACPHCQTEYFTHYMSNHVRELQTKFQKTRSPRDQIPFNQALTALQLRMKSRGYPVNPEFS